jgi:hypothetical protein
VLKLFSFPTKWKSSVVKVIKKTGVRDFKLANSYRPISLLSVFAKIFEKLLINRIRHYLTSNGLLSSKQYGFKQQKSTEDALHSVKNFIDEAFMERGFALIIAVDIIGAFDNMWWTKVLHQMRIKKCPKNLYLLARSYFENRSAKLWYLNQEVERELTIGCLQGSASGPHYWNIQYDDLLEIDLGEAQGFEGFADDTIFKARANNIEDLEVQANNALKELCEWAVSSKLSFNPNKTKCILFTKNIKYRNPDIYLQGNKLEICTSFKHLGVYLDRKLNWNTHCNYVKTKASNIINNLLVFAKNKFGLNGKALETIYKGAVLPIISYACSVWISSVDKLKTIKTLQSLQRQVALRITKAYRTVSNEALDVIANLTPIDLYLKKTAINYFIKKGIVNNLTNEYLREYSIDLNQVQKPLAINQMCHYAERLPINIAPQLNTDIVIFTNGYKTSSGVGAGFCIMKNNIIFKKVKYKLAAYCTVFQ